MNYKYKNAFVYESFLKRKKQIVNLRLNLGRIKVILINNIEDDYMKLTKEKYTNDGIVHYRKVTKLVGRELSSKIIVNDIVKRQLNRLDKNIKFVDEVLKIEYPFLEIPFSKNYEEYMYFNQQLSKLFRMCFDVIN